MQKSSIPLDKLVFFQEQLGLGVDELRCLHPYRTLFIEKKDEFAGFFYYRFYEIAKTRLILEHMERRGAMKQVWANWFESFFRTDWDESFYVTLWNAGLKHVDVNLDQAFVNLGYCFIRQFCHQVICSDVPAGSRGSVSLTVNKMLDLCLLVETHAYMAATSYCDREVMKGLSHQMRNPITIIGGNALRIQKKSATDSEIFRACNNIILESARLEKLVKDIAVYLNVFQRDVKVAVVPLEDLISSALDGLEKRKPKDTRVLMDLDPNFPDVQGDQEDLETMFHYLIENSMEALPSTNPVIKIKSRVRSFASYFLEVEIFNTGPPPSAKDLEHLSTPFSSSKPSGTGFGLPIAKLAAKKNLASLVLLPLPGEGTKTIIQLPLPG